MQLHPVPIRSAGVTAAILTALCACAWLASGPALAQDRTVYRCPGPPVLYTDSLSAQEARSRGCTALEGATVTIVPATKARPAAANATPRAASDARIDPADQRARDSDARRILADELQREETKLAELRKEYNNGEPERMGSERNYQRYLDRVAELKSALARKEADVAAIRRELAKLQP